MVKFNGARYRVEDALRLGLLSKGSQLEFLKAAPGLVREHKVADGLLTATVVEPAQQDDDSALVQVAQETGDGKTASKPVDPDRPNNGQSKKDWVEYALKVGLTPENLEGLGRDQIIEVVEAHQAKQ